MLFGLLDATVSPVGQQCLYHRLRSPLADEVPLQDFDAAATLLAQQPGARGQALLALTPTGFTLETVHGFSFGATLQRGDSFVDFHR